jgi:hypothetical protein
MSEWLEQIDSSFINASATPSFECVVDTTMVRCSLLTASDASSIMAENPECGDVDSAAGPNSGETVPTPATFTSSYDAHHRLAIRGYARRRFGFHLKKRS